MTSTVITVSLPHISTTEQLASDIASCVRINDILLLDGELGAGKTTFVRALVVALGGHAADVSSPSYTLLHCYEANIPCIHIDAYRLQSEADLEGLGFSELQEGAISCIEWAQRIGTIGTAEQRWEIKLDHDGNGGRIAHITAPLHRPIDILLTDTDAEADENEEAGRDRTDA